MPLEYQVISVMTLAELTDGVQASALAKRQQNQAVLDELVRHLTVLDWPQGAAMDYAAIRAALKAQGAPLGAADLMIAAHARSIGATVVTNKPKDFGRVEGLRVENWLG